jgi:putative transposase
LIDDADHFWQKRYYDFNIRNCPQFGEKLRYIHRNPVKLGLCERPEDWEWSSFRHYATVRDGSRSGQNGRHENANERWGDFVLR